ncbi:serine--tRNA ligase [Paenibacillus sp. JX-17]|uniref:Serine--tRNA ligase n=1 Tax=Paenibacillus lacisoli TaxID=3064525 RepID=A0ABT9CC00_9BACL|nr:serine--tRNA ligase [Paenibacillus sp. JX-17]MDO7906781.1 serine--tRNA ligase [Paenibacillus sp. JX-17]
MLDMKWVREHAEAVQEAAILKGLDVSVEELLELDVLRRNTLGRIEVWRQERNEGSAEMGRLLKIQGSGHPEAVRCRQEMRQLNDRITEEELKLAAVEETIRQKLLQVPNLVSPDSPRGASDADNVVVRHVGELPVFDFPIRDHVELGELHGIVDITRGVKTGGARSYYLKGAGLLLHRAVQQLALDLLCEKGFVPMEVPLMVRGEALEHTGFFPSGQNQTFRIAEENRWLAGTSEVPLISYYAGETVDVREPIRLAGISACFRREVGSAGRDVRGLYRVHQFAKVEQVVICEGSLKTSELLHTEITAHAEQILQLLELPYRVMAVCTGDMSQKTFKQWDIETWMAGRGAFGETHSSSNLLDFQARRANIRYRDEKGQLRYCHTLNNTAVAAPRILIPLLENHQEADGSIRIPKALQPYVGGMEKLTAPHPKG